MQKRTSLSSLPRACQFLLLIYIIFTLGLAGAVDGPCDFELSKSAERFLRTLRSSVAEGVVAVENLQWMIRQRAPSNPVQSPRTPENLAFKRSFEREIPRITTQDWQFVVEEAHGLQQKLNQNQDLRQYAVDTTKHVYHVRPTEFYFATGEQFIQFFVSSRGEPLVVMQDENDAYLYNFTTGEKSTLPGKVVDDYDSIDFFETSTGDLLLAIVTIQNRLTVQNVRTKKILPEAVINRDLTSDSPLIAEEQGVLSVFVGSRRSGTSEQNSIVASFKVQFQHENQIPMVVELSDPLSVVRLKDGHLYARTVTNHFESMQFFLKDLTLGNNVITAQDPIGNTRDYIATTIYDTSPKILLRKPMGQWFVFVPEAKRLQQLSKKMEDKRFVNYGDTVLYPYANKNLFIRNVMTGHEQEIEVGGKLISDFERTGIPTPLGMFVHAWDSKIPTMEREKIHLYNLDTGELNSLSMPFPILSSAGLFYSPLDGRILVIAKVGIDQWQIFQVYGPERHQH